MDSSEKCVSAVKAYFLSDFHLGAPSEGGAHEAERRVVRFLEQLKDATDLYLVGDILDYWYEYRYVVPRGFVRFFGQLAHMADRGVRITWLIGNHDIWIFDYLPGELGIEVVDGAVRRELGGKQFYITHGDAIGGKRTFRVLRALFRNRFCQWLYSGIHPRWTVGFANAWSRHSRAHGLHPTAENCPLLASFREFCALDHSLHPDTDYYVFGHLHIPYEEPVGDDAEMIVLGDWLTNFTYGVFDGDSFKLRRAKL